jgi:hypothetical protein
MASHRAGSKSLMVNVLENMGILLKVLPKAGKNNAKH